VGVIGRLGVIAAELLHARSAEDELPADPRGRGRVRGAGMKQAYANRDLIATMDVERDYHRI
jgi:hypothetical protein